MKRLLFVDDEVRVLAAMKRMLYPLRHGWIMEFANSGGEALEKLSQANFDVLITDLMMPGMSGTELLGEVVKRHPAVTRIVLSGAADQAMTLSAVVGLSNFYLVKPCDSETLRQTLNRALVLRFLPEGTGLQKLIMGVQSLPVLPAAYVDLMEALDADNGSIQKVGEAIGRDPALTAKVLQLVNSAYFGLQRQIRSANEAVVYLGTEVVRAIVLSVGMFSQFDRHKVGGPRIQTLRDHSLGVATLGRTIAKAMHLPAAQIEEAFTGGILHDVGGLILAGHSPKDYVEVEAAAKEGAPAANEAELRLFGATHAQVAAYLLWLWGLPDLTTQIVALHHGPLPARSDPTFGPLIAVRASDQLWRNGSAMDWDWLEEAGFASDLPQWRELAAAAEGEAERRIA